MPNPTINYSKEPIRLFKSDFLEFFTHISPVAVIVIWLPVALFFLIYAALNRPAGAGWVYIPIGFILGIVIWTLSEYLLHRFVFHFHAKSERGQRITFLFHGVHHAQPQIKTRLVMPPVVSIPLALVFYGLYTLVVGILFKAPHWVQPLFSGFIIGYLIYDLTHYATHHFKMNFGYFKMITRYHMLHHYQTPDARFGVSSPFWDNVFGTRPADRKELL